MAMSPIVTGVGIGSTPTVETLNTDLTFEQINTDLTVDPLSTNLISTTETINLGSLRDMGLLPPSQVLVDQALNMGVGLDTSLALDPATANLASDFKVAALANSPKFIQQGYRPDIMNAIAAGIFNGYVQTLEATDPAALDPYRISEGSIYLTGQLADNRLVFSQIDNDGLQHYLRANSDAAELVLTFIRGNNVPPERANALIQRGVEKGMFAHVPHAAVGDVARVVLDNTPGLTSPAPAPVSPPEPVGAPDSSAPLAENVSGQFTQEGNKYTLLTEQGTQFTLTHHTEETLNGPALDAGAFRYGGIEIQSTFFSDEAGLEAGAILGVHQLPSQPFQALTDDGPVITGGGGLREFAAKLFAAYNPDLANNLSLSVLGEVGIVRQEAMDQHWAAREVYDNTSLALNLAIQAGLGDVAVGASVGQEGTATVSQIYTQLISGQVGLRLEFNSTPDDLQPVLRFVHTTDGQDLAHDQMRPGAQPNAFEIQVKPREGGVDLEGQFRVTW